MFVQRSTFLFSTLLFIARTTTACPAAEVDFSRDIRPILGDHCLTCHGPDEKTREADLRLDKRDAALSVLSPGDVTISEVLHRITSTDQDLVMPPPEIKKPLTQIQIEKLKDWIKQGAPYTSHWAFSPPQKTKLPRPAVEVKSPINDPVTNEIDLFVRDKLAAEKLHPSTPANKTTLLRRVTFDLTGLPPTPEEAADFLSDNTPNAFEKVVDRLLSSPSYGEHMAASWLDLSRYADTDGYQNDRYRYMHVWRDWVIMAFNDNMPYDQFITEQLAGDMLPAPTLKQQIATGFCRNHRINSEDGSIPEEWHVENVVDRVDTLGTAILGLTIGCARCHDHKYDPISQKEYYQLFAFFNNVPEWGIGPNNGNSPPFIEVPASWPILSEAENVSLIPEPLELSNARKEKGNGLKRPQAGSPTTVMVMAELPEPRKTYRLDRGQYNTPDRSEQIYPNKFELH